MPGGFTYRADYLVLAHSPDAGLLTGDTHHELISQAPVDLRIHHVATTPAR
ncbi:hypothetical protein [Nocardia cyriacigeorgica]|uniref:hypothetical protein n=1 Tax=Nocardia cyriacigeorgica TaxID=135487 RepID=UPI0002D7CA6A|nr:hypothetical protein [Nocardia cyriacigeorgica]